MNWIFYSLAIIAILGWVGWIIRYYKQRNEVFGPLPTNVKINDVALIAVAIAVLAVAISAKKSKVEIPKAHQVVQVHDNYEAGIYHGMMISQFGGGVTNIKAFVEAYHSGDTNRLQNVTLDLVTNSSVYKLRVEMKKAVDKLEQNSR